MPNLIYSAKDIYKVWKLVITLGDFLTLMSTIFVTVATSFQKLRVYPYINHILTEKYRYIYYRYINTLIMTLITSK